MSWFTFNQNRNVNAYQDSFEIRDGIGHFVIVEAANVHEANTGFHEATGARFGPSYDDDCYDSYQHYCWEQLSSNYLGTETPQIWSLEFLDNPHELLHRLGTFGYVPLKVVLYPERATDRVTQIVTYTQKDFDDAEKAWRKHQPKLWAAQIGSGGVVKTRRVIQSDFDSDQYFDKTGNFGGEISPEKETSPKGWDYAYFASTTKKNVDAYVGGAHAVFHTAFAAAEDIVAKMVHSTRGRELSSDEKIRLLGARRALKNLRSLSRK